MSFLEVAVWRVKNAFVIEKEEIYEYRKHVGRLQKRVSAINRKLRAKANKETENDRVNATAINRAQSSRLKDKVTIAYFFPASLPLPLFSTARERERERDTRSVLISARLIRRYFRGAIGK